MTRNQRESPSQVHVEQLLDRQKERTGELEGELRKAKSQRDEAASFALHFKEEAHREQGRREEAQEEREE